MERIVYKGTLITVEGIHGAGKSEVSQGLVERLEKQGLDVVFFVDQAGTDIGKKIREINLAVGQDVDVLTEALLVAAARRQNIAENIKPNISDGKIVVCERYTDAYFAFQGFGRELPMQFIKYINFTISEGIEPDLTLLLDLDPEIALSRLDPDHKHRIEEEGLEFHEKVRQGYLAQAQKNPNRINIVNAALPVDKVCRNSWVIVKDFLISKDLIKY